MTAIQELKDQNKEIIFIPAPGAWWWDGPERFQKINRNNISSIQKEKIYQFVQLIFRDGKGIEIGGGGIGENCLGTSIDSGNFRADGRWLPFKDDSFDYLIANHTLEHINAKVEDILSEWARIVKPGGWVINIMPDKTHFKHSDTETNPFLIAYNEITPEELKEIIEELGCFNILIFDTNKNNLDFEAILEVKENWVRTCKGCGVILRKQYPWGKVICPRCGWIWERTGKVEGWYR